MAQVVLIRGRTVSTNRVISLLVCAIIMATVAAINLGYGINFDCWGYDGSWCDYQKNTYIIVGSCFAASAFLFLVSAISLHYKIKQALQRNEEVIVQQPVYQATNAYPTVVVAGQYPPTQPHNPAPVGFVVNHDVPSPGELEKQHQPPPPPYSP